METCKDCPHVVKDKEFDWGKSNVCTHPSLGMGMYGGLGEELEKPNWCPVDGYMENGLLMCSGAFPPPSTVGVSGLMSDCSQWIKWGEEKLDEDT